MTQGSRKAVRGWGTDTEHGRRSVHLCRTSRAWGTDKEPGRPSFHLLKSSRGWVTVEMAFAALGLGLAIVLCAGGLGLGLAQIRVSDAAAEIARQAARDDLDAIREVSDRLPEDASIDLQREGNRILVTVSYETRPWGDWLPCVRVSSQASIASERRGT